MDNTVALYLMTFKGFYVLQKLIEFFDPGIIECVVIGRDQNIKNDYSLAIKELCIENKIQYYFRSDSCTILSTYSIAISWRWMIPQNGRLIVLHDSLLPKYRGFAPIVNALINGDSQLGVTALFAKDEYDKGNIIQQESIELSYPKRIAEAIEEIAPLYFSIINNIIHNIFNKQQVESSLQIESEATYSLWRDEEDYHIDWSRDSVYVKRFIDAVGEPYSAAFSLLDGNKVRIFDAEIEKDVQIENRSAGKVIFISNAQPIVVCGSGLIRITKMIDDGTKSSLIPFTKIKSRFK